MQKLLRQSFPCAECASTEFHFYCDLCRAEWDKRIEEKLERNKTAKHRKWYARRKAFDRWLSCFTCGKATKGKRRDARYCSNACRQRAHRKVVSRTPEAASPAAG